MRGGALWSMYCVVALAACHRGEERPQPSRSPVERDAVSQAGAADSAAGRDSGTRADPPTRAHAAVIFLPDGAPEARVTVDVAIAPREIQRGLMYREHLPPDGGMVFVFREPKVQHFWMKNTLIPLDMIFVASDMTVAGVVARTEPQTTTSRFVERESQFVVEVNGGWAAAHGVTAGTKVRFDNVPVERATVD